MAEKKHKLWLDRELAELCSTKLIEVCPDWEKIFSRKDGNPEAIRMRSRL